MDRTSSRASTLTPLLLAIISCICVGEAIGRVIAWSPSSCAASGKTNSSGRITCDQSQSCTAPDSCSRKEAQNTWQFFPLKNTITYQCLCRNNDRLVLLLARRYRRRYLAERK